MDMMQLDAEHRFKLIFLAAMARYAAKLRANDTLRADAWRELAEAEKRLDDLCEDVAERAKDEKE